MANANFMIVVISGGERGDWGKDTQKALRCAGNIFQKNLKEMRKTVKISFTPDSAGYTRYSLCLLCISMRNVP